jgi:hypothetical protein
MPTQHLFNALSGLELKQVILNELSRQIDLSGEFSAHITYPYVEYSIVAKVLAYPKQAPGEEPAIRVEAGGVITKRSNPDKEEDYSTEDLQIKDGDLKVVLEFDSKKTVDTPDQERADNGLALPTPTPVKNVGIVDKPMHVPQHLKQPVQMAVKEHNLGPQAPEMAEGLPGALTQATHDVGSGHGRFARSVTVGTAAADPQKDNNVVSPGKLSINTSAPRHSRSGGENSED